MYKKYSACILFSAAIIILGQFFIFRIQCVFNLSLATFLYDNGSWIADPPKVLLMGSSRCYHSLVPEVIATENSLDRTDVANVGMNGGTPFEMLVTYKKIRHKMLGIKYCFFVIDPEFFWESVFIKKLYERSMLTKEQWEALSLKYGNFYYLPVVSFFNALCLKPPKVGENQGFYGLPHVDFLELEKKTPQDPHVFNEKTFPFSRFQLESLAELKKMVEDDGGHFVFVVVPVWDASSFLGSKNFKRQWNALVVNMDAAIGPVRVVGDWKKETYALVYEDFKDRTHLSLLGARAFTAAVFSSIDDIAKRPPVLLGSLRFQD